MNKGRRPRDPVWKHFAELQCDGKLRPCVSNVDTVCESKLNERPLKRDAAVWYGAIRILLPSIALE